MAHSPSPLSMEAQPQYGIPSGLPNQLPASMTNLPHSIGQKAKPPSYTTVVNNILLDKMLNNGESQFAREEDIECDPVALSAIQNCTRSDDDLCKETG